MGAINGRLRRHRRNRLAAEMYCTWTPRRLFTFGSSVGWAHWFDDPNTLYRRRNRLTYSRDFSNAAWLKSRCTAAAPAGGFTTITEDTSAAASHYWYRTAESAPVGTYGVYTLRVKKSATRNFALWVGSNASNPIDGFRRYVDLSTGGTTSPIIDGTGVVEISTTVTEHDATTWLITCVMQIATGGTAFGILNCLVNGASLGNIFYTGDGASSIQAGYAQLETYTTTASEYQDVPTTWAQAYLDAVGADRIYAWKDTAGTDPVTAVGEGIGLLLGREYGGARGANKVTTTDLTNAAWTSGGAFGNFAGSTVSGNTITGTGTNGSRSFRFAVSPGDTIEFTATAAFVAAGGATSAGLRLSFGTSGASLIVGTVADNTGRTSGTGAVRVQGTAPATASFCEISVVAFGAAGSQATFSDMAARTIPGTHLIQATGTARPTLSARVNLLTYTEQFDNAAWTKTNCTVTANSGTAPNGTASLVTLTGATLNKFVSNIATLATAGRLMFRAKAGTHRYVQLLNNGDNQMFANFDLTTGTVGTKGSAASSSSVRSLGDNWYELVMDVTPGTPLTGWRIYAVGSASATYAQATDSTGTFYLCASDLRTADDAAKNIPAYQRVGATAADHDTEGFPHYALFDGTDDSWASAATVDGSGSDKVTVVTGVTKNSDAAAGVVYELTASIGANNGAVALIVPSSNGATSYGSYSRGTVMASVVIATAPYAAPQSAVVASSSDISADALSMRINGVSVASSTANQGTGNYANATLYVGRRGGASNPANIRLYSFVFRFGAMGEADRNRSEQWTKNLMRLP